MRGHGLIFYLGTCALVVMVEGATLGVTMASTFTTLYRFTGGSDGSILSAGVVRDSAGVLYGATNNNGAKQCIPAPGHTVPGCGTVFSFSPLAGLKTIVSFTGLNGAHGANTLLLKGKTLYGSTTAGGASGDGVVFSVGTDGSSFTLLHQFTGADGQNPAGALQMGVGGVLYGITASGGPNKRGVLFQLDPTGVYAILHAFTGGADGAAPNVVLSSPSGTLVGSTYTGGTRTGNCPSGCGLVYAYATTTAKYLVLHSFNGITDGGQPIVGSLGPGPAAYGVNGGIFTLTPANGLQLVSFGVNDGFAALSGPTLAADESLIGVNSDGPNDFGASGELYQEKNGLITALYLFGGLADGRSPQGQPLVSSGQIFGTTNTGGTTGCIVGCGTIYQYTP